MTIFDKSPRAHLASIRAAAANPVPRDQIGRLILLVACFALSLYALSLWLGDASLVTALCWFVGAALAHDVVLFPLYAVLDKALHLLHGRLPKLPVSAVNHVRVPALGAGLTFLVFLPGIIRQGAGTFTAATGLDQSPYLGRWLLLVAAMVVVSALVYAVRALRSR